MLHQKVCDELDINREELAKMLGISKYTIDSWSDSDRMSQTAKVALKSLLENNSLKKTMNKFNDFLLEAIKDKTCFVSNEKKELANRIKFILNEYKLTIVEAAKRINEISFEYLDRVLNLEIYPSFDFLSKFSNEFKISNDWLLSGKGKPFDLKFLEANFIKQLIEEFPQYKQAYIVRCEKDGFYTKIIIENKDGMYDIYHTDFCIGDEFIMEASECVALYDLYKFYKKFYYSGVRLLELSEQDYEKLLSREFYPKNILHNSHLSFLLTDLFDLEYFNKDRYGDFFIKCTDIIKDQQQKDAKKNI